MIYDILKKPPRPGAKEPGYYIVPVNAPTVSADELADEIAYATSLTRGDVRSALCSLVESIAGKLAGGHKVRIDELGLLEVRLTTPKEDLQAEDKVAKKIRVRTIAFTPAPQLMRKLSHVSFQRTKHPRTLRTVLRGEALLEQLRAHFRAHDLASRADIGAIARCGKTVALGLVRSLVADGYITNISDSRHPLYRALPKLNGTAD